MSLRMIGMIVCTLGCLGGSLAASLSPDSVDWSYFVPAIAVGVLGVVIARIGIHRASRSGERMEKNFQALDESLARVVENAKKLEADKERIDPYDFPQRIDDVFVDDLAAFADARESIAHAWGVNAYADIMTHFAAGERYLNRVWSAAADGYANEAKTYVTRALDQFVQALARFEELKAQKGTVPASAV